MPQRLHQARWIVELNLNAIPAAWLGSPPIRHGLASAPAAAWRVQQQPQIPPREHGESRARVHLHVEPEVLSVERDRRIDVVHDIADADRSHGYPVVPLGSRSRVLPSTTPSAATFYHAKGTATFR